MACFWGCFLHRSLHFFRFSNNTWNCDFNLVFLCFLTLVCKTLLHASSAAPKALVQGLCPICNTFLAKLSKQVHSRSMPSVAASACLPACLSACLPACLSACLPACLLACLFSCLLACLPAYLPPTAAPIAGATCAKFPTYMPNRPNRPSPLP